MASSRKILSRIKSAKNISQITKAMQMVSASKMRRAQELAINGEPYSIELRRILIALLSTTTKFDHLLLKKSNNPKSLCIFVTTNKGLCGGLNTNHFRQIMRWYKEQGDVDFITVGKKGRMFANALGANILADFSELPENIDFIHTLPISRMVLDLFKDKEYGRIYISYNKFISTLSQKPLLTQFLPIDREELKDSLGLLEELTEEKEREFEPKEYLLEPNKEKIINWLLPYFAQLQLYHFLLENKASEHSARMVAMKGASENAKEIMEQLRLIYNRLRQQQITSELADIITASAVMN
ncbi:ATP synthase F1 subunit gamma [Candidatus Beckwithbacteria bacterium]|nr:ATP synthase F1 subunit gamma [Candidatus Beckwithbacteria bacterium]